MCVHVLIIIIDCDDSRDTVHDTIREMSEIE